MLTLEERFEKTRKLAETLFPGEEWVQIEQCIYVAESRFSNKIKEIEKLERELEQVRILTNRGSVVFFLPEHELAQSNRRCADIILDSVITEIKTVTGRRATLGGEFRLAFKQGAALLKDRTDIKEHSVFVHLLSDLSVGSVRAKIAGELKTRADNGSFICYFEKKVELYEWSYSELRSLIGS